MSGETTIYAAVRDGFILGRFRREGEKFPLTPAQAEWELRAGRVREAHDNAPAQKPRARTAKKKD